MSRYEHAAIVGVGLLGGSIGMTLRSRGLAKRVTGIGRNTEKLQRASDLGAIDDFCSEQSLGDSVFDLAIICTPVQYIASWCERLLPRTQGLVTDVGSTKVGICQSVRETLVDGKNFCGSHPMAGSEKEGVENAQADLFEGKVAIVTPDESTPEQTCRAAERLWAELGCETLRLSPEQHDHAVASTSHLPHIVAATLAAVTEPELRQVAASGWSDTTRVASGSPELWRQIICENRGPIASALKRFSGNLERWVAAVESGDENQIQELLERGKARRDALGN